jgi:tripartite-type tricarboxylate transporter receptor subunit TctC
MIKKKAFRSVQDRWNHFSRAVLPNDVPAMQYQEMRKAFISGYFEAMQALNEASESGLPGEELTKALNEHVKAVQETLAQIILADMKEHQRKANDGRSGKVQKSDA